jgi:1,4-alpha-glucan branching enzyme
MADFGDRGILGEAAFRRRKLGAALVMTSIGVPMLWMGEEFGEYKPKTTEPAKIDWTLLKNDGNLGLFKYYQGLIALRKNNRALHTTNINFFHENPDAKVFAYVRWNDEGSRVVVVVNLSDQFLAGYQIPDFPENGVWHEWTKNYDIEARDGSLIIDLGEYEAQVFVWH